MAINVFGVLIWCGLAHCSPIRRAREIAYFPCFRLTGTLDRGMGAHEALTLPRVR